MGRIIARNSVVRGPFELEDSLHAAVTTFFTVPESHAWGSGWDGSSPVVVVVAVGVVSDGLVIVVVIVEVGAGLLAHALGARSGVCP